jgi:hypothetical protein
LSNRSDIETEEIIQGRDLDLKLHTEYDSGKKEIEPNQSEKELVRSYAAIQHGDALSRFGNTRGLMKGISW